MARQLDEIVGKKFSDMTFEEQIEFIQRVRKSRSTQKATSKVVKKVKRAKKKQTDKAKELFASLTDEQKQELIRKLTNGEG